MSDSLSLTPTAQTITFNEIPADRRDPGVLVEIRPTYNDTGLLLLPSRAIIISQMLATGMAKPGQPYAITGAGQAEYLFGAGSVAATQINAWRLNNTTTPFFAVGLADVPGAVAASSYLQVAAGTFPNGYSWTMRFGGMRVPVVIPPGSSSADLQAACVAAVNANTALPVTAAVGPTGMLFTAKNAGVCGNSISMRITDRSDASAPILNFAFYSPGIGTPSIAGQIVTLLGGLGNPDITPVITTIAGTWYTDICTPFTDPNNRAVLAAEVVRALRRAGEPGCPGLGWAGWQLCDPHRLWRRGQQPPDGHRRRARCV